MNEVQKSHELNKTQSIETETVVHKRENALVQSKIDQYSLVVENIESQIKETNRTKQRETGVVAGVGDWLGEKTELYETGNTISARIIERSVKQAKETHTKILADFQGKELSLSEKTKIDELVIRLEKVSRAKLEHVSWGKAVFNSASIDDIQGNTGSLKNRAKIGARATIGVIEGGYEGISGIMEITGKALGILSAYSFAPETQDIIKEDISNMLAQLTLENVKKVVAMLPKVLDEFSKLPPEKQSEGASKLIGMILVPLGIGVKGVQAGKALAESGIAATKMGIETTTRAARIVAKQADRAYGVSQRALKVAGKAGATGLATAALGTGGTALAGTAVAGGSAVRFIGEMGGGGKEKVVTEAALQKKIAKAEARSRVPYETVLRNSNLPEPDRFALAATLIGHELTPAQQVAIRSIHNDISKGIYQNNYKELRVMVEELDKVGIPRPEGRKLMENGVLGNGDTLLNNLSDDVTFRVLPAEKSVSISQIEKFDPAKTPNNLEEQTNLLRYQGAKDVGFGADAERIFIDYHIEAQKGRFVASTPDGQILAERGGEIYMGDIRVVTTDKYSAITKVKQDGYNFYITFARDGTEETIILHTLPKKVYLDENGKDISERVNNIRNEEYGIRSMEHQFPHVHKRAHLIASLENTRLYIAKLDSGKNKFDIPFEEKVSGGFKKTSEKSIHPATLLSWYKEKLEHVYELMSAKYLPVNRANTRSTLNDNELYDATGGRKPISQILQSKEDQLKQRKGLVEQSFGVNGQQFDMTPYGFKEANGSYVDSSQGISQTAEVINRVFKEKYDNLSEFIPKGTELLSEQEANRIISNRFSQIEKSLVWWKDGYTF